MNKEIFESKSGRKVIYKTESGIEIKPMLHEKQQGNSYSQNITYYYVYYKKLKNGRWIVFTNKTLYGENKTMGEYESRAEAESAARIVNKSIHFLMENIE